MHGSFTHHNHCLWHACALEQEPVTVEVRGPVEDALRDGPAGRHWAGGYYARFDVLRVRAHRILELNSSLESHVYGLIVPPSLLPAKWCSTEGTGVGQPTLNAICADVQMLTAVTVGSREREAAPVLPCSRQTLQLGALLRCRCLRSAAQQLSNHRPFSGSSVAASRRCSRLRLHRLIELRARLCAARGARGTSGR